MTKEEAILLMKSAQLMLVNPKTNEPISDLYEALDMAIKALEQEPCDDCVSRQAVLKINENYHGKMPNHINFEIWNEIKALPPVIPKRNLEAWDKIIEEIEQLRARFKESGGVYEHSTYGLDYATEIINKHLNAESEDRE